MKNSTIEARVAHLEAQNRTLRRTGIALAATVDRQGAVSLMADGAAVPLE